MKICYIAEASLIHTHRWVNYFAARGHEVHVISLRFDNIVGAKVYQVKNKINLGKLSYLFSIRKVRNLISEINPDIVHAHHVTSYGLVAALSRFAPLFLTCHGSDVLVSPKKSLILKIAVKLALSRADLVISVARHMTERLVEMGVSKKKILTLQYGLDLEKFRKHKENDTFRNGPVIISTRQLKPIYNIGLLLKSSLFLLKKIPSARFIIIGDGPEKNRLERMCRNLGIQKNVEFTGRIPHERIPDYLNLSTVFVSTSLSDGTSLCLLEAMACELFPVVTDIPANREWIKDKENGFLVPVNEPLILAQRIFEALNNASLRKRAALENRRLVTDKADFENNMKIIEQAYDGYLSKKN